MPPRKFRRTLADASHRANARGLTRIVPRHDDSRGGQMLTPDELERYARHIVLREVGGPGQAALKTRARAGGRRRRARRAGADVSRGGRRRHARRRRRRHGVAVQSAAPGHPRGRPTSARPKVESAAAAIARLNPHVAVETHPVRLTAANALDLIGRYDLVADGSDNFATRYLVSDACYFARRPLVTGGGRHLRRHAHDDPRA